MDTRHSIHKWWRDGVRDVGVINNYLWEIRGRVGLIHDDVVKDLIVLKAYLEKENEMPVRADLPNPTLAHAEWLSLLSKMDGMVNMRDYRDGANTKDKRLWLSEAARRLSAALHAKLLDSELVTIQGEDVNCYKMTDEGKAFWQNGREQNLSNDQILEGWMAMQSLLEDTPKGE